MKPMLRRCASIVLVLLALVGWALLIVLMMILMTTPARAQGDPRCAWSRPQDIPRDARGEIKRSTAARAAYVRAVPCPATGQVSGACPGWQVNHVVPLSAGGRDDASNMAWLPNEIKTCGERWCVDRWERRVYARACFSAQ